MIDHLKLAHAAPPAPAAVIETPFLIFAGIGVMTASQIEGMGPWLVDLLSGSQLEAAAARYNANTSLNQQFFVPMTLLRTTWNNHFHRGRQKMVRQVVWWA